METTLWPGSLKRIAEWCGVDAAIKIWEHYAGCHLSVPKHLPDDHRLVDELGIDAARSLSKLHGGEILSISKCQKTRRAIRDEIIRDSRGRGEQLATLARRHDLTERQIMVICSAGVVESTQIDVFD